jgi:hypothetical protein
VNSSLNPGVLLSLWELPFDLAQVVAGGIVGAPVSRYLKNSLPSLLSRIDTMPSPPKNVD